MQITPSELARRLTHADAPRLLDVREPDEHSLAALPNSLLIPLRELVTRMEDLAPWRDEDQEIVVYCHHGVRSLHAISILREAGFQRLINLQGGIDRWSLEVDPALPRY